MNRLDKNNINFCIIGGGYLACMFLKILIKNKFKIPIAITWKSDLHQRDRTLLKNNIFYEDIFECTKLNNIPLIETDSPNNESFISLLKKKNVNLVFSIACRWILSKQFIDAFEGRVINIHLGNLPLERGGAIVSRKILNDYKVAAATIHLITHKIDQGPILYKRTKRLDKMYPTVNDFNELEFKIAEELFNELIKDICSGKKNIFNGQGQDETQSIYLPQLYTETNGAIDWSWSGTNIERFIRAFGPPFPGAFTFYENKKVSIIQSRIEETEYQFHPFYSGRIIGKGAQGSVRIATIDKILVIEKIVIDGKVCRPSKKLKLSKILYTHREILEKAKISLMSYSKMRPPD
jgi:methionyl-tRNA formyltransferase